MSRSSRAKGAAKLAGGIVGYVYVVDESEEVKDEAVSSLLHRAKTLSELEGKIGKLRERKGLNGSSATCVIIF